MKVTEPAAVNLERIQVLWDALQRELPDGPKYIELARQIHVLSEEYEALVAAAKRTELK
jgi:hypothetical protein